MKITKAQSQALLRKWQQRDATVRSNAGYTINGAHGPDGCTVTPLRFAFATESFLAFRRSIVPMFGGDGAIVVEWCRMWLAIEEDGYCHS